MKDVPVLTKEQDEEVLRIINGCIRQDGRAQKELYRIFYNLSMKICLRYAENRQEAIVIMNDGFFRVFTSIKNYDIAKPFAAWLSKIMANAAVDHYRSRLRFSSTNLELKEYEIKDNFEQKVYSKLNYEDLLKMIHSLTPAYRTVFNLYAIEGYSHEEIAKMLGISSGTSKSNLFKARMKLSEMIRFSEEQAVRKKEVN